MVGKRTQNRTPLSLERLEERTLLSWGTDGIVLTSFTNSQNGGEDFGEAVVLQTDGRVVAVGHTRPRVSKNIAHDFALARYNTSGSLDSSFDGDGKVTTQVTKGGTYGGLDRAYAVALQTDGKIIAGGSTSPYDWLNMPDEDWALVRYRTNGRLDTSFGSGGKVITNLGTNVRGSIQGIAIQPNGKMIAAGGAQPHSGAPYSLTLMRYNSNGSLDTSFGTGGKVASHDVAFANAVVLDSVGRIVVAGSSSGDLAVLRYNSNGTLDTSFGTGGKVNIDFGFTSESAEALAIDANGRIIVAGSVRTIVGDCAVEDCFVAAEDFAVARLNADGSLDTSFDGTGWVTTDASRSGRGDGANAVTIQPDGKIIAAGYANPHPPVAGVYGDFAVVRYNPDGSLDSGSGLLASRLPARGRVSTPSLTPLDVQPLLTAALSRWEVAGVDTGNLVNIDVRISDLPGALLGEVSGNTIWLDENAAGWGWFVDPTPWEDSEFRTPGNQGERNRMDLLTVLEHEIGHLLGYEHADSGVMGETLAAETRRVRGESRLAIPATSSV